MNQSDWHLRSVTVLGIDLAWGDRNPDGIVSLRFPHGVLAPPEGFEVSLVRGDSSLLNFVDARTSDLVFAAVDAPTIGPNETGSRPVDRICSRLFRSSEAGCHPVNRTLCQRPFRIAKAFQERGFQLSSDLTRGSHLLAEVYPHPAMIRFFGLAKTIKYKRGPVANRRVEFSRYQDLTRQLLAIQFSELSHLSPVETLLSEPWSKGIEDQLDALFSSLIGWWHLHHLGASSECLGDEKTGTILLPNPETSPLAET
ncbi:MAG: DUF429 domain-containing protein [Verrucomicrobiales bacterium]|nr:DUF429 domain-containing protein [Verrucomicrobiales bacterium]